ncbi:MAG: cysteine--tRNA ligase [Chthoniobacteraceae bacterium]
MAIRFLNTYTRELEEFTPLDPAGKLVRMYTCGPTVYNHAHIGNYRAYVFEDLLQRHLEARGFDVLRVMNLTDVDDKTIRNSRAAGKRLADFTAIYKEAFFEDLDVLRIKRAQHFPAATEPQYIERMIAMIGDLVGKGIAYQADDRSVYFRLSKFPDYGKLAHLNLEELRPSGRVSSDEYEKESVGDFALWKAWDENDGEVKWDSPWGAGRPGWHIECSAMATALLGPELDIHCGGVDNIFPHHEAEIAQSGCCTGKKFVRYWLHCAHLMVEGQKMSKSLGNFYTLRDLLAKGWTGREVRYALLTVNYRLPLNFTIAGLEGARSALKRIDEWVERLTDYMKPQSDEEITATVSVNLNEVSRLGGEERRTLMRHLQSISGEKPSRALGDQLADHTAHFFASLDDDLNISGAMGHVFDLIRDSNRAMDADQLFVEEARRVLSDWARMNDVLSLRAESQSVSDEVLDLVAQRQRARAAKNWAEGDRLRDEIAKLGWNVKDTKDGQKLTPR